MLPAAPQKLDPRPHLLCMTLRRIRELLFLPVFMNDEFLKIGNLSNDARAENRDRLFRKSWIAFRTIDQLPGGSVSKFHLRGHAIRERRAPGRRPGGLRENA